MISVAFSEAELAEDCTVCGKPRRDCEAFKQGLEDGRVVVLTEEEERK